MEADIKLRDVDVLILCGGKGERIRSLLNDRPKPMCEFGGRPFLSMLMEYAADFGFRRFILCGGYQGEVIKEYYTERPEPWDIDFCLEKETLGTGGAIKNAKRFIQSEHFLVMNGDSFSAISLDKFLEFHLHKKALLTMALVKSAGNKNSGKVVLNRADGIVSFEEKKMEPTRAKARGSLRAECPSGHNYPRPEGRGFRPRGINKGKSFNSAGIYFMDNSIFSFMKDRTKFSLEYDLFPSILEEKCFGYVEKGKLIDFGTPKEYRRAQVLFAQGSVLA